MAIIFDFNFKPNTLIKSSEAMANFNKIGALIPQEEQIVTLTYSQTLTNKILTSPAINGGTTNGITLSGTTVNSGTISGGTTNGIKLKKSIINGRINTGITTGADLFNLVSSFGYDTLNEEWVCIGRLKKSEPWQEYLIWSFEKINSTTYRFYSYRKTTMHIDVISGDTASTYESSLVFL